MTGTTIDLHRHLWPDALETPIPAGTMSSFGPDHIHRLDGAGRGSVSLNVDSPPLWRVAPYAASRVGGDA